MGLVVIALIAIFFIAIVLAGDDGRDDWFNEEFEREELAHKSRCFLANPILMLEMEKAKERKEIRNVTEQ